MPHTIGIPMQDHKNSILQIKWPRNSESSEECTSLYSCGAQNGLNKRGEVFEWDLHSFKRTRQFVGHQAIVNSIDANRGLLASASDDATAKVWDVRSKKPVKSFDIGYSQTSVCFSRNNEYLFVGGIDNQIRAINLNANRVDFVLQGHFDTITDLSLSKQSNGMLASNSFDNSIRIWDVRPYLTGANRELMVLKGHAHNFEKNLVRLDWSHDDKFIAVGSADRLVYVWKTLDGSLYNRLAGHRGHINCV